MEKELRSSLVSVLNFDHGYENQDFYKKANYQWINFTQLSGVNGYCQENSLQKIRKKLRSVEPSNIHFIGSGNYHYITYLFLERIKELFILVLFDHHTDMQPSFFEGLLSCGCWVKHAIDKNPYLKKVILIGAKESLLNQIPKKYQSKVFGYAKETVEAGEFWNCITTKNMNLPVYLSIDKDVITKEEVITNWDQGSLSLEQLRNICDYIVENYRVLGIDICGECSLYEEHWGHYIKYNHMNNKANARLLRYILRSLK